MESGDVGSAPKLEKQLSQNYRDFMTRVTKLDELVAAGNSFLASFQQGLEFLHRPPLDRRSELFESIVKANETRRLNSYFDDECFMKNRAKQNLVKCRSLYDYIIYNAINVSCILHRKMTVLAELLIQFSFSWIVFLCCRGVQTCLQGLHEHLNEAKTLLSGMKSLLELATTAIEALNVFSPAGYLLSGQECIADQDGDSLLKSDSFFMGRNTSLLLARNSHKWRMSL